MRENTEKAIMRPLREILSERKTIILKEPLVKRLSSNNIDDPDDLVEKYIIKERMSVPGPEVKRIHV